MKTFHNVLAALNEIAAVPGKIDKQKLVEKHLKDPDFEKVVNLLLNPFKRFYIKNFEPIARPPITYTVDETYQIFDELSDRVLSGSNARIACGQLVADGFPADLMIRILNKDPKAGFSESTVNKAKKGSLPDFPYMRCLSEYWEVESEDGTLYKISEIVDKNLKLNVKCRNLKTNTDEYKPVINSFDNGHSRSDWFTITYIDEFGETKTSKPLTGNHVVFLSSGEETTVDQLKPTDTLY